MPVLFHPVAVNETRMEMGTDRLLRSFPNLKAIVCTELCLVVATSSVCQWRGVFKGVSVNGGVYSRACRSMYLGVS